MDGPQYSASDWDRLHFTQSEAFAEQVRLLYQDAINDATQLATGLGVDTNKPFSFDQYPAARNRLTEILTRLADRMQTLVQQGQTAAWTLANNKGDAFVESVRSVLPALNPERVNSRNLDALAAFQNRKVNGLGLSDRIFKYSGQFKREIELGLDIGIGEGRSANQISQSLRSYMEQPDKLFRRVRDKRGNLALSKAAAAYHPGQGVYRSSFKNAQRLARTEINMAYREAEHLRLQGLPFVVGYEVRRSNRVFNCDVCDPLAGKYPKTFKFVGWHPNCRCSVIPILLTPEEFSRMNDQMLLGEEVANFPSSRRVDQPHAGWFDWVDKNRDKLNRAKSKPFFVRDNPAFINATPAIADMYQVAQRAGFSFNGVKDATHFNESYSRIMKGFDLATFDKKFNDLTLRNGITIENMTMTVYQHKIQFMYDGRGAGGGDFALARSFTRQGDKLSVSHDLFIIPKATQGGGFSKDVFKALYEQYQHASVDQIYVHANIDVGGYAWARYGFTFKNQSEREMVLRRGKRFLPQKDVPEFLKFWDAIKDEKVFPMQAVAKSKWGKKILLGSDWEGVVNLKDDVARNLFEDYLFGR